MNKTGILLGAAAAALLSSAANAGTLYVANLSGANEVPPTTATFSGNSFLILNDAETSAVVTTTHNINITMTGGHIHRGPAGVNGPVIFNFPNLTSPIGPLTWAIPTADVATLKAQGLYVNLHTTVNPGGAIRGQLVRFLLAPSAGDASQLAVANALDVSAGYTADLDSVLTGLAFGPTTARAQALSDLSGSTIHAQGRQAQETMVDADDTLFAHADDLAADAPEGVGGFIKAGTAFGKRDTLAGQSGAKISRPSIMGGIDFGLSPTLRAGVAVGYADGKDKFRSGAGRTTVKTTSAHAYLATGGESVRFSATAGYGWAKVNTRRNLASLSRTATSSHDARVWSLAAKVSVPMALSDTATLSPYGRLDVQHARIDAYSEAGAGSAGLVVPKRTDKTSAAELGAALALPMGEGDSAVAVNLQAGWRHLLDDGKDSVATRLSGSPVGFQTLILSPGKDSAHIAANLSAKLGGNLTGSAGYRGLISKRTNNHAVEVRLSLTM